QPTVRRRSRSPRSLKKRGHLSRHFLVSLVPLVLSFSQNKRRDLKENFSNMISDILFEALQKIEYYQVNMPDIYCVHVEHIEMAKRAMWELISYLDVSPAIRLEAQRDIEAQRALLAEHSHGSHHSGPEATKED